jgi:hypothetical protein
MLYRRLFLLVKSRAINKQSAMYRKRRVSSESLEYVALVQLAAMSQPWQETHQGPPRSRIRKPQSMP